MAVHPARTPRGGLGYLREHPNPRAIAHPTDGGLRYHGRPPDEWGGATSAYRPRGQVMAHTSEGVHDTVPPDIGAESTTNYLATTDRQASYHLIGDSDSAIWLLPPAFRAWHIADSRANYSTFGWAIGGHAARVYDDETWMRQVIAVAAPELDLYRRWCWTSWEIYIPLELRSLDEILAGAPGFGEHGQWQTDRSDPGFSQLPASVTGYRPRLAGRWSDTFDALADLERARPIRPTTTDVPPPPDPEELAALMAHRWIQIGDAAGNPQPGGLYYPVPGLGLVAAGKTPIGTPYDPTGKVTGAQHKDDLVGAGLTTDEVYVIPGQRRFDLLDAHVKAMTPERATARTVNRDVAPKLDDLVDAVKAIAASSSGGTTPKAVADELARRLVS